MPSVMRGRVGRPVAAREYAASTGQSESSCYPAPPETPQAAGGFRAGSAGRARYTRNSGGTGTPANASSRGAGAALECAHMSSPLPLLTAPAAGSAARRGILDVSPDDLRGWLAERGQPPMRVGQIRRQILGGRAASFEQMSDLPKELRADLAGSFAVFASRVERHLTAADGTHKLVLRMPDDRMIECVLIQDEGRATACVSTQVGCGMGCVFCASGINGVVRNLTPGEILEQMVMLRNLVGTRKTDGGTRKDGSDSGMWLSSPAPSTEQPRLSHIVVMGMGEPLANLDNLLAALAVAGDKNGLGHRGAARHDLDRRAAGEDSPNSPRAGSSIPSRSRSTPRTTRSAPASCRPTTRPGSTRSSPRPTSSSRRPGARSLTSTSCSAG